MTLPKKRSGKEDEADQIEGGQPLRKRFKQTRVDEIWIEVALKSLVNTTPPTPDAEEQPLEPKEIRENEDIENEEIAEFEHQKQSYNETKLGVRTPSKMSRLSKYKQKHNNSPKMNMTRVNKFDDTGQHRMDMPPTPTPLATPESVCRLGSQEYTDEI